MLFINKRLLLLFLFLTLSLYILWQNMPVPTDDSEPSTAMVTADLKKVATANYLEQHIAEELAQSNIDEAEMYRNLAEFIHVTIDPQLVAQIEAENTPLKKNWRHARECANGFTSGQGNNIAQITCAIVSDFTLVGDIRDFSRETYDYVTVGEIDEFIYILSIVGIAATATTVFSSGVAAPVKMGVSVLKLAKKTGNLSKRLIESIISLLKQSIDIKTFRNQVKQIDYKNFAQLKGSVAILFRTAKTEKVADFFNDVHKISKATSVTDTVRILKYADNTEEVKRLGRLSENFKHHTKGVLKVLGKKAIRFTKFVTAKLFSLLAMLASLIYSIASFLFTSVTFLLKIRNFSTR